MSIKNKRNASKIMAFGSYQGSFLTESSVLGNRLLLLC